MGDINSYIRGVATEDKHYNGEIGHKVSDTVNIESDARNKIFTQDA